MTNCRVCGKESRKNLCVKHNSSVRRHRNKIAGVTLLGGKCIQCGEKNINVLQFHHKDPSKKDFGVSSVINKSWKLVKKEILKCELLCANCHVLKHQDREDKKFLEAVYDYDYKNKNQRIEELSDLLKEYKEMTGGSSVW